MLSEISRVIRKKKIRSIPGKILINNIEISDLRPLGGFHRAGITKAGRLSFCGKLNNKKVKVYETFSQSQIDLIKGVSSLHQSALKFPRVICHDERYVVEEWIEGSPLIKCSNRLTNIAAESVSNFINTKLIEKNTSVIDKNQFCYFENYILPRAEKFSHWSSIRPLIEKVKFIKSNGYPNVSLGLSHPDLSASNILYSNEDKNFYIIDNELLSFGVGWLCDVRNSFLKAKLNEVFLNSLSKEEIELEKIIWCLRQVGTYLDKSDFHRASSIAMQECL